MLKETSSVTQWKDKNDPPTCELARFQGICLQKPKVFPSGCSEGDTMFSSNTINFLKNQRDFATNDFQ